MTLFDLTQRSNEIQSFDSKAACWKLSRGDDRRRRRRRDQRGHPQEERSDFLTSDGEGSIETRGNVVGGGL